MGVLQPAEAHTASEAIAAGCGSGFKTVTDGHRAVTTPTGAKWGDVYLTYNASTRENCVVTVKTSYHGTASKTLARIAIEGESSFHQDWKAYEHFAAIKVKAGGKCVAYWADIAAPTGTAHAAGGRWDFANCG
ncbi:hypothetical protein VV02_04585 [Luteipulveratus mongoliensis]|uniref:Spore-associated protein A n=1 Tax=Luteipulveratus mongoliensis TaxID=571913 RepID=A0A0K1JPK4_9MICO|nr:hypothetical protein VV02_04585 [Luteipulveratus mongoliensis]